MNLMPKTQVFLNWIKKVKKKRKHDDILDELNVSAKSIENLIEAKSNNEKYISPKKTIEPTEKNTLSLSSLLSKLRDNSVKRSETVYGTPKSNPHISNKENDFEPLIKKLK